MDEERARELLDGCIDGDGLSNTGRYLSWPHKNKEATLDGEFTADDLEAIAWWMRNKGQGITMDEPKFCKDCKHYRPSTGLAGGFVIGSSCYHPDNMGKPDIVSGSAYPVALPIDLRKANANCGEGGLMFEVKPPKLEPVVWSNSGKYAGTYGGAVPDYEIRKPGWGHPIMLLAYAVVALFVGLLAWAVFG